MALTLEDKKAIVLEISQAANEALSLVVADYSGLSVAEMIELRAKARQASVYMKIVRNTLAKRALAETNFACICNELKGPLILAFSKEAPGSSAKLIRDFAKEHEKLEVKALSMDGQLLPTSALDTMATLPNREEALSLLLSAMQAPVSKFVQTLAAPQAKLVRTLAAVKVQKEAA